MKVRIGYGIGAAPQFFADVDGLGRVVDDLDRLGRSEECKGMAASRHEQN